MKQQTRLASLLLLGVAAGSVALLAYGLQTGEIRGRYGWINYAEDPVRFWNWVTGYALGAAASLGCLILFQQRRD